MKVKNTPKCIFCLLAGVMFSNYIAGSQLYAANAQSQLDAAGKSVSESLLPADWDPVQAGNEVLERMISVTAPHVKGAHDGDFVIVGDHAYIVSTVNEVGREHSARRPEYVAMSIVDYNTMELEVASMPIAKPEQVFDNETLPSGLCWVPRILQINDDTLRIFFVSGPAVSDAQIWYRDFDLASRTFENSIYRAKLKTSAGVFDMRPQPFYDDAVAHGFTGKLAWSIFVFDSFRVFDGITYVGINNFAGRQNALAKMNDTFDTFEIVGHINEPADLELSENSINRLPDGTWMAILRSQAGNRNYAFSFSEDGRDWTPAEPMDFVQNGTGSKPTFDQFNGIYYLGWQDAAQVDGVNRSIFNVDVSRDGKHWERKYRFETTDGFDYPTFKEHDGIIWVRISGDNQRNIKFGKLETISK
jgi:hypothetical protein